MQEPKTSCDPLNASDIRVGTVRMTFLRQTRMPSLRSSTSFRTCSRISSISTVSKLLSTNLDNASFSKLAIHTFSVCLAASFTNTAFESTPVTSNPSLLRAFRYSPGPHPTSRIDSPESSRIRASLLRLTDPKCRSPNSAYARSSILVGCNAEDISYGLVSPRSPIRKMRSTTEGPSLVASQVVHNEHSICDTRYAPGSRYS